MSQYERLHEETQEKERARKEGRQLRAQVRRKGNEKWRTFRAEARNRKRYQASKEGQIIAQAWKEMKNAAKNRMGR